MTSEEVVASGVVAVLRGSSGQEVVDRATRLAAAGVQVLEVTFTLDQAPKAIHDLTSRVPSALVGAGTVLNGRQAEAAVNAGARFLVAPNFHSDVERVAIDSAVPYIPAAFTPTELAAVMERGYRVIKLFPAVLYGPAGMRALLGPFPAARLLATGGVRPEDVGTWLQAGAAGVGLGSALIRAEDPGATVQAVLEQITRARTGAARPA